jgi:hypothetical protein
MQELLHEIDLEYYRSAQLLIVHAEIEQLRRDASVDTCADGAMSRRFRAGGEQPATAQPAFNPKRSPT